MRGASSKNAKGVFGVDGDGDEQKEDDCTSGGSVASADFESLADQVPALYEGAFADGVL